MSAATFDDCCKNVWKLSKADDSFSKKLAYEVDELQEIAPWKNVFEMATFGDSVEKTYRTTDSVHKKETPSCTDLDGFLFEVRNLYFGGLKWNLLPSLGRRQQFLLDVILYVCSLDIKLDEYQALGIRHVLFFEYTSDFTVHIGNYVRFILNENGSTENFNVPKMPSEKIDLDVKKKILQRINKYGQDACFEKPCGVVAFLVNVCKLCSSLTEDCVLEKYLSVVIESVESVIKNSSDHFVGYEELSKFCGERNLTNCLKIEKREKSVYSDLQNLVDDVVEDLYL